MARQCLILFMSPAGIREDKANQTSRPSVAFFSCTAHRRWGSIHKRTVFNETNGVTDHGSLKTISTPTCWALPCKPTDYSSPTGGLSVPHPEGWKGPVIKWLVSWHPFQTYSHSSLSLTDSHEWLNASAMRALCSHSQDCRVNMLGVLVVQLYRKRDAI